jgi:hypothetical protein
MRNKLALIVSALIFTTACIGRATPEITPTSEVDRRWNAPPVLVEVYIYPGVFGAVTDIVPTLVLYNDGRIIVTHYNYDSQGNLHYAILEAYLSSSEVCAFLMQFETEGFFEPEVQEYSVPEITDQPTTHITVKAWRNQRIEAYALGFAMDSLEESGVNVPPALAKTYTRLTDYTPPNAKPYQPDRIALQVIEFRPDSGDSVSIWPLADPSLAAIDANLDSQGISMIYEGDMAKQIYSLFDDRWWGFYSELDKTYIVIISPLVPLQSWNPNSGDWPSRYSYPSEPKVDLNCNI